MAISAVLAVALHTLLCMPVLRAAPVSVTDAHPAESPAELLPNSADPRTHARAEEANGHSAEPLVRDLPGGGPGVEGVFHSRELELNITEDEYKRYSPPAACVNPDSILRHIAGAADDCPAIKPGHDEDEVFNLPFLAICGWILVVLAVAGLYRFWGVWRLWRWLHRMRAQGLIPSAASSRRTGGRRSRPSSSRNRPRSRRYAGYGGQEPLPPQPPR